MMSHKGEVCLRCSLKYIHSLEPNLLNSNIVNESETYKAVVLLSGIYQFTKAIEILVYSNFWTWRQ